MKVKEKIFSDKQTRQTNLLQELLKDKFQKKENDPRRKV